MKILSFTLTLMLVALGVFSAVVATSDKASAEASGRDFLAQWTAFLGSEAYRDPAADLSLEYLYETRNWRGERKTKRRIIRFGNGEDNPLVMLEAMKKHERLRNVEASPEHKDVYTMVLPEAITLKEAGKEEVILSANVTCQLFQGRPRRFIFLAEAPRRWLTQQVRIVQTWNYHSYEYENGSEERIWAPVEIWVDKLVRKGPRQAQISQRWTLLRILAVKDIVVGPIQVVVAKKSEVQVVVAKKPEVQVVVAKKPEPKPTNPSITITETPPAGAGADWLGTIAGKVQGINVKASKVVIFAYGDTWYVQPWADSPYTEIGSDGKWETDTHLGFKYAALLVKSSYRPPARTSRLPKVGGNVLAIALATPKQ